MLSDSNEDFLAMFQVLETHNVYATNQFYKEICGLVKTEKNKFIKDFLRDFSRINLKEYKKYERLKLTPAQSKRMDGKSLFRYEYRKENKLTQKEFANKINVNQTMVSKIESGKYNPTFKQIYKISRKLTNSTEMFKEILKEIIKDIEKAEYATKVKVTTKMENGYKVEEYNGEYQSKYTIVG